MEIEEKHDLLRFKIDGWCAWPLLRFFTAQRIHNLPLAPRPAVEAHTHPPHIWILIKHILFSRRKTILINTYSSFLSEKRGEKYTDVFFDDFIRSQKHCMKVEWLNNPLFATRSAHAEIPSVLHLSFGNKLFHWLARRAEKAPDIRQTAEEMSACFAQEEGLFLSADTIANFLAGFRCARRLSKIFLRILRPRAVLTADPVRYGLYAAAREMNIPVAEMQHGFIDRMHYGYSWSSYARPYKALIPRPKRIFLYGEYWKRELLARGFWEEEDTCITGGVRMDNYRSGHMARTANEPLRITFTTQGIDVPQVIEYLQHTLALLKDTPLTLTIKLHPFYDRDTTPYLTAFHTDPRVAVIRGDDAPSTYEILLKTDLHMSIASTCHYEALALGVPTIILPFTSYENVTHLLEDNSAVLANDPATLAAIIRNGRPAVPQQIRDAYFISGAVANMNKELNVLIGSR